MEGSYHDPHAREGMTGTASYSRVPSRVQARDEPCQDEANCDVHRPGPSPQEVLLKAQARAFTLDPVVPEDDIEHVCAHCREQFGKGKKAEEAVRAHVLERHRQYVREAHLGLATTREMLAELKARAEMVGYQDVPYGVQAQAFELNMAACLLHLPEEMLNYRTVDS